MEKRYVDITEKESNYGKIYKVAGPRKTAFPSPHF